MFHPHQLCNECITCRSGIRSRSNSLSKMCVCHRGGGGGGGGEWKIKRHLALKVLQLVSILLCQSLRSFGGSS